MSYFVVDTFTPIPFNGNPSAVVLLDKTHDVNDELKQKFASEFGLSSTSFPSPIDTDDFQTAKKFSLKWFTPDAELGLCGSGTLAVTHVLSTNLRNPNEEFEFETRSGLLKVHTGKHDFLKITLPAVKIHTLNSHKHELTDKFEELDDPSGIGKKISEVLIPSNIKVNQLVYSPQLKYLLIALDQSTTHEQFTAIKVPREQLLSIDPNGDVVKAVIITFHFIPSVQTSVKSFLALTSEPDYVLRVFEPWTGVDEDSATGSAQCIAGPFWAAVYNRGENLRAHQYHPKRSSEFRIDLVGNDSIEISGNALTTLSGTIADRCLK